MLTSPRSARVGGGKAVLERVARVDTAFGAHGRLEADSVLGVEADDRRVANRRR